MSDPLSTPSPTSSGPTSGALPPGGLPASIAAVNEKVDGLASRLHSLFGDNDVTDFVSGLVKRVEALEADHPKLLQVADAVIKNLPNEF